MRTLGTTQDVQKSDLQTQWNTLKAIVPYMWDDNRPDLKARVVVAMLLLVAAKATTIVMPFFYKWAVDDLTVLQNNPAAIAVIVPVMMIVAYGVARMAMNGLAQLRDGVFSNVTNHATRQLAVKTFRHLHGLSLAFHLERKTGALGRVLDRGTGALGYMQRLLLFNVFPILLELVLVTGVLLWQFDWRYAVVVVVSVAAYFFFTYLLTEWRNAIRRALNEHDTASSSKAVDSLLNFETVKYFTNEAWETERYDRSMAGYEKAGVGWQWSLSALNFVQALITSLSLIAVMVMAGYGIQQGEQTMGDFVMLNALLIQMFVPLNLLGTAYREIKQALIDMEKMFEVLDVDQDIQDRPGATPLVCSSGEIRFDDVHFRYEEERPILKGVSFTVKPGTTTAVVGPTGAGKSTLSRLLYRFYEPEKGLITIDGQDIGAVTQDSLRRAIGIVPQDTVLFNDTILYNIRYGRPDADDEAVEQAAKMAQIHDFIVNQPRGYGSLVGERGLKLSGGEKQRVAIARTILKNPPLLILDEATSALDSKTEQDIQSALQQVSANRTTLVIAHRLTTVVDADEILVMDDGRVIERGTHQTLLDAGGMYAALWNRQHEEDTARETLRMMQEAGE